MPTFLPRLMMLLGLAALSACGAPTDSVAPEQTGTLPGYEELQDGDFVIPQVERKHLWGDQAKQEVDYAGDEAPGSIVVDTFSRKLYFVLEGGRAMRYAIAVGREGIRFTGSGVVGRMEEWPSWQPTANMIRTRPDLYAEYAAGLDGGLDNPLGSRAMYLYRGGRDSMFRIHGTIDDGSIGHATSAGCIRLFNQDAIDLFERVEMGAKVKVRSAEESLEAEGAFIDDINGRVVPDTEENLAKLEADRIAKAERDALAAEVALKEKAVIAAASEGEARKAAKEAEKAAKAAEKLAADTAKTAAAAAAKTAKEAEMATKAAEDLAAAEEKSAEAEAAKAVKEAEKAAKLEEQAAKEAEAEAAKLAKAEAKALAKRLAECEKLGIAPEDCPAPGEPLPEVEAVN